MEVENFEPSTSGRGSVLAARWGLELGAPLTERPNLVVPATPGAILKIGPETAAEGDALQAMQGPGCVRLLDREGPALLLERVTPGWALRALADDDAATRIAARVMRALSRPPRDGFATAAGWGRGFQRPAAGALPRPLVDRAAHLYEDLLESGAPARLLHGDLHHDNLLRHGGGWVAIDPKGVLAEPAYEVGAWMRNPEPLPRRVLDRRLDLLAEELALDRGRLWDWSYAQAVLAAIWSVEDGEDPERFLAVARALVR